MKKVNFGGKPNQQGKPVDADSWVQNRDVEPQEATKRLTIDVPVGLHKRIKTHCVQHDRIMAEVLRELLEQRFPTAGE